MYSFKKIKKSQNNKTKCADGNICIKKKKKNAFTGQLLTSLRFVSPLTVLQTLYPIMTRLEEEEQEEEEEEEEVQKKRRRKKKKVEAVPSDVFSPDRVACQKTCQHVDRTPP